MYITACEGVQSTQNDDLGVMGSCWFLVARENESTSIFDDTLLVEGVQDELLNCFRHRSQIRGR